MEKSDLLRIEDQVTVTIWGPENKCLYKSTNSGFHTIEGAISAAVSNANLGISPEDCVFEVKNETTDVTHKYRLNAHGHVKLII